MEVPDTNLQIVLAEVVIDQVARRLEAFFRLLPNGVRIAAARSPTSAHRSEFPPACAEVASDINRVQMLKE